MQSLASEPEPQTWTQIAPLLDSVLAQLGEKDHNAIVLRFFEGRSFGEVGLALGTSEDAAKKRIKRAVERLRRLYQKRGLSLSAGAIATAISAHSVQAAPFGLATSVTVAACNVTTVTTSTLNLITTTLKLMAWTKLKTAVVVGVVAVLGRSVPPPSRRGLSRVSNHRTQPPHPTPPLWRMTRRRPLLPRCCRG